MATSRSVSDSGDGDIDALLSGSKWSTGNLTFSFPATAASYSYSGEPQQGFVPFSAELKTATRAVLKLYGQYANLTFTETTSASADLRFGMADIDSGGRGYFPGDTASKSGDVWLPTSQTWTDIVPGGREFWSIMHEVGHALGLSHLGSSFDPDHVGHDYSIMSYQAFPAHTPPFFYADLPQTPMLADIAALQYMYGANYNTRPLDTVYMWSPTTGELSIDGIGQGAPDQNKIYMTIWDGGGVDTYDFSNYAKAVSVDLRPGEWSTPGVSRAADGSLFSDQLPLLGFENGFIQARGSIANAFLFNGDVRSLIENATGGGGNDTIVGNQADNILRGGAGDDTLFYTGGTDTFFGDARSTAADAIGDTADFSLAERAVVVTPVAATRTVVINGQTITLPVVPGSAFADIIGNRYSVASTSGVAMASLTGIENLTGSRFGDSITGDTGDNIVRGGDGNDRIFYTGGFDRLSGDGGSDTIDFSKFGAAVAVTLVSSTLTAEAGTADTASIPSTGATRAIAELDGFENVTGTNFDDVLTGNKEDNVINGGSGADRMSGGAGDDTYLVDNAGDVVVESLFAPVGSLPGIDTVISSISFTLPTAVENLTLTGFAQLNGTGNGLANVIVGNLAANTISGLDGDDTLEGRGGNDTVRGGQGSDTYVFAGAQLGNDTFIDTGGTDTVVVDSLADVISANRVGNDLLVVMTNGSFRVIDHFAGQAIERIEDVARSVVLSISNIGGDASGIIAGSDAGETLDGRGGDDLLFGGKGNDRLLGGQGNDRIDGGKGRDVIDGGAGDDVLTGGGGRDTFVFTPFSGNDVITDFSSEDVLDLSELRGDGGFRWDRSFGFGQISIAIDGDDTLLSFEGGSVRVENYTHFHPGNLIL
jgi:serralysin